MDKNEHLHQPFIDLRYSRQVLFPPVGNEGQKKLINSRVTIVGMGALGTVLANHMVRAGVGLVRLIDRDFVEESNLQRQMLYDEDDARNHMPKVIAAAEKLNRINSAVQIDPIIADVHAGNAEELLVGTDLILDGTDNFAVRFLINDVSVKHRIPWIYGGAVSSRGMYAFIRPHETACFRCLFPGESMQGTTETCDTVGVIAPIVFIVASHQAGEALKWLTGNTDKINCNLEHIDIWRNSRSSIGIANARSSVCPACAHGNFQFLNPDVTEKQFTSLCGRNTIQITPAVGGKLDLDDLSARLSPLGKVEHNKFLLRFHVNPYVIVFFPDSRVLVQGTDDTTVARTLYAKYVGM